jgi:hypothetical protein
LARAVPGHGDDRYAPVLGGVCTRQLPARIVPVGMPAGSRPGRRRRSGSLNGLPFYMVVARIAGGPIDVAHLPARMGWVACPIHTLPQEVPCFNTVIEAAHDFDYDALNRLRNEGSRRFGPRDNTETLCESIDSYYWLSANRSGWSFGSATPMPEAGACSLEPRALRPHTTYLAGDWRDAGDRVTDCVIVNVYLTDGSQAHVHALERYPDTQPLNDFRQVRITGACSSRGSSATLTMGLDVPPAACSLPVASAATSATCPTRSRCRSHSSRRRC